MPGHQAPFGAPCVCESISANSADNPSDPRLVGLVTPGNIVEALWGHIAPDAQTAFDMIDTDSSGSIDGEEVLHPPPQPAVHDGGTFATLHVLTGALPHTRARTHS